MNQTPYIIIVTADNCSACQALHKTGEFYRGNEEDITPKISMAGFQWSARSFWDLMTATPKAGARTEVKFKVIEYEIYSMQSLNYNNVKSITIFSHSYEEDDDGKYSVVHRNTYQRVTPTVDKYTFTKNDGSEIDQEPQDGSFNEFLSKYFPISLSSYTSQFPCFIYISSSEMNKALKDFKYSPFARSFSRVTAKKDDRWVALAQDMGKEPYKANFILYAKYISENPSFLSPPIEEPTPPEENSVKSVTFSNRADKLVSKKDTNSDDQRSNKKRSSSSKLNSDKKTEEIKPCVENYTIKIVPLNSQNGYNY